MVERLCSHINEKRETRALCECECECKIIQKDSSTHRVRRAILWKNQMRKEKKKKTKIKMKNWTYESKSQLSPYVFAGMRSEQLSIWRCSVLCHLQFNVSNNKCWLRVYFQHTLRRSATGPRDFWLAHHGSVRELRQQYFQIFYVFVRVLATSVHMYSIHINHLSSRCVFVLFHPSHPSPNAFPLDYVYGL